MCVTFAFVVAACSSSRHAAKNHVTISKKAWVTRSSRPFEITKGLQDRHLTVWASHGRYYKQATKRWEWQRPNFFCTNEDLFTQTFVVPYVIPMLENAGATVFTPRERAWQEDEIVIDNDKPQVYSCIDNKKQIRNLSSVKEYEEFGSWKSTSKVGFALPKGGVLTEDVLPFESGTARQVSTSKKGSTAFAAYTMPEKAEGDYAVYVSYQSLPSSVDDAHYTVYHDNQATEFRINQQMGGGTWVYLGTFHFSFGTKKHNAVVLENDSHMKGVVTTDAVRFGGGMGTVERDGKPSGLPRCDEGARYYCQWAGAPKKVFTNSQGADDYKDDINVRSLMQNWLSGGSVYNPKAEGLNVPIELSVAMHSDAGYNKDFSSIFGSLGIRTTAVNNRELANGESRDLSTKLMDAILKSVEKDMEKVLGKWNVRSRYDKNYSETRLPAVPSTILEMFSHQSYPDMKLGHDPYFKFQFSRAVYKAIARYLADRHQKTCVIAPLAPINIMSNLHYDGKLRLSWDAQNDLIEPEAKPTSYVLYTAKGDEDFDNGVVVGGNDVSIQLEDNIVYRFRLTAINDGGESFPSEEVSAFYVKGAPKVLVVNGFHRLAAPQVVDNTVQAAMDDATERMLGFDMTADPGVPYGRTAGWAGYQKVFYPSRAGGEGPGTFGYCGSELEGKIIAGNDFNYATTHVKAIASTNLYSVVTCSSTAISKCSLDDYFLVDVLLGNERNDGYSLMAAKALPEDLKTALNKFKGSLFVSGSYVASDTQSPEEQAFLSDVLNVGYKQQNRDGKQQVRGMGTQFDVWRTLNSEHYASTASDVLINQNGAFPVLAYNDGGIAAVASNQGQRKTFVMGFPFECIKQEKSRNDIMKAILKFLK